MILLGTFGFDTLLEKFPKATQEFLLCSFINVLVKNQQGNILKLTA